MILGSKEFCTYDEYDNTTLKHRDLLLTSLNNEQCRQQCDTYATFNCRGYSVIPTSNSASNCILHSEDSKLVGPKLLKNSPGTFYEKARCLNGIKLIRYFCIVLFILLQSFYNEK